MRTRHPRNLAFVAGHAPMIGPIPIWPRWVADSRVILYGGALLAMYLSIVHAITLNQDAWVPIAVIVFTSLPGIYDRIYEARSGRKDQEHAVAIQELRLEIELLKGDRELDRRTIATLTAELDQSRILTAEYEAKMTADLEQSQRTIAEHEANILVLTGQLRDARQQIAQLSNPGPLE